MFHNNQLSGREVPFSRDDLHSESVSDTASGYWDILVEGLDDSVILFDANGSIRLMNSAGRTLLGLANDVELGAIGQFIGAASRERFEETVKPQAEESGVWYGSILLAPCNSASVLVSAMLYHHPAYRGKPTFYALIGRPITGAVDGGGIADLPVRFTSRVLESLHDAVFVVETPSRFISYCNSAAEAMFGYGSGELIGQPTSVIHVDNAHYEEFGRFTSNVLAQSLRYEGEYPMRRSDGSILDTRLSVTVLEDPDTHITAVVSILRDITAEKQAAKAKSVYENQLRALVARLDMLEAEERRSVAAYLHDDVIQTLALARNKLTVAESVIVGDSNDQIVSISGLVDSAIAGLRAKISELAVAPLAELGLVAALECVRDQLEAQYGPPIRLVVSGTPVHLSTLQRNVLFTGARQLMINALTHAHPTRIEASLVYEQATVTIHVQDNGVGFPAQKVPGTPGSLGGFGLFHLSERLMYVGGRLDVQSTPGLGATVSFWIPITNGNHGD